MTKEHTMPLTDDQLTQFHRDGYLFFPGTFSPEEAAVLRAKA